MDYLVGTNVFELEAERARLDVESQALHNSWVDIIKSIYTDALKNGVKVAHLPRAPVLEFSSGAIELFKSPANENVSLDEHKKTQLQTLMRLQKDETKWKENTPEETLRAIEVETENLQRLTVSFEASIGEITLHRASKNANDLHIRQAKDELVKNEGTNKLIKFGASLDLNIAKNVCPSCYQSVGQSLTDLPETLPHMDITTNIDYLKSQIGMLERDNAVIAQSIREVSVTNEALAKRIAESKYRLHS